MQQRDAWHPTEYVLQEDGRGDPFAAAMRYAHAMVIYDPRLDDLSSNAPRASPATFLNAFSNCAKAHKSVSEATGPPAPPAGRS